MSCSTTNKALSVHTGPYRIGVSPSSKSFVDEKGNLAGLYLDVFRAAAKRTEVPYVFVNIEKRQIEEAIRSKEIDIHLAAADFPSRHRPEFYLAEPWWSSPLVAVVTRHSPYQRIEDLAGRQVTVPQASAGYWDMLFPLAVPGARRADIPSPHNPIEALCKGETAAALIVGPDAERMLLSRPAACREMDFRLLRATEKVRYSLMSRAELRPVVEKLDAGIRELAADGELARISSPWLGLNSAAADELGQSVIARRHLENSLALAVVAGVALLSLVFGVLLWRERRANRLLEAAMERARLGERVKTEFLAMMSHEIRTPLNGVLGMTEIILTGPLNPEQQDAAATIHRSSVALLTVLNDILDVASFEAGCIRMNREAFALRPLLDDVMNLVVGIAQKKQLGLYVEVAADVPEHIVGDPARLRQILLNLVGNAVKFTDQGRVFLRVSLDPEGSTNGVGLRFCVEDTGPGIRASQMSQLFSRFTQLDASINRRHGGAGLGLAISKSLVEAMGGRLCVTSTEGAGSQFYFTVVLGLGDTSPPPLQGTRVHIGGTDPEQVRCLQLFVVAAGAHLVEGASDSEQIHLWIEPSGGRIIEPTDGHTGIAAASARLRPGPVSYSSLVELIAATTASVGAAPAPPETVAQPVRLFPGRRVLVAEDNAVNRRFLSALLGKLGCTVFEALDGEEAVTIWRDQRPEVILMDCQMPGVDGYEATRRIRAEESGTGSQTVIWAVTANVLADDRQHCNDCGMDNVLAKPLTRAQLEATLESIFGVAAATE